MRHEREHEEEDCEHQEEVKHVEKSACIMLFTVRVSTSGCIMRVLR